MAYQPNSGVIRQSRAVFFLCIFFSMLLCTFIVLPSMAHASATLEGKININTATSKELQQLPFIGADRAKSITRYRAKHGYFSFPEELLEVHDIGNKTIEAIRPYLAFAGGSTLKTARAGSQKKISSMTVRRHLSTNPGQIKILPDGEYFDALRSSIHDARERITMVMFLFKITKSPGNRAAMIMNELIDAAKRGVQILVVLDRSNYNKEITKENTRVARQLRKYNITVRLDGPNKTTHSKAVVIDERYVFLGSHNLTHSALSRNNEFSLLIDSRDLAWEVTKYIKKL